MTNGLDPETKSNYRCWHFSGLFTACVLMVAWFIECNGETWIFVKEYSSEQLETSSPCFRSMEMFVWLSWSHRVVAERPVQTVSWSIYRILQSSIPVFSSSRSPFLMAHQNPIASTQMHQMSYKHQSFGQQLEHSCPFWMNSRAGLGSNLLSILAYSLQNCQCIPLLILFCTLPFYCINP